ncbi:DUF2931 family protein [Enterobacter hormaechei]|jgi:hypothetical protein|nr:MULTISPECIES: DUF2931 family protein [Enterobacter cloacae complex]ARA25343.1 hypothetical protein AM444_02135 [Enterobacter cloacae complex sp.]MBU5510106.1 DUF2931 family protein [Enterobacteriaceae bacterium S18_ASV_15]MBU5540100.1 DUF2931 family protein [Pluralibacter sp. S10_ASV_43]MBU5632726.1 DUF2931 family protein [Enterobacteriaceae bacterium S29_ASV_15]MBU5650075.1 DUF2931 family protein [Enterobacteriaceae bacterium S22_ASV_15]OOK69286.1 hypothetical protein GY25_11120 [Pedobact
MNKKSVLLAALLVSGCAFATDKADKSTELSSLLAPYDEWYFDFAYPKALPAVVTYAELLDTDSILYRYRTLDGTNSSDSSVGSWGDSIGYGIPSFNKAKNPPRFIHFCWDSVIDKRVYETTITFGSKVWEMMLIPYFAPYDEIQTAYHNGAKGEQRYHRFMVIGLAPEGKVRVWLQNSRKPNIELTDILVETVSGDKLDMCKNITDFSRGYKYSKGTEDFIKGKKYPYGEW